MGKLVFRLPWVCKAVDVCEPVLFIQYFFSPFRYLPNRPGYLVGAMYPYTTYTAYLEYLAMSSTGASGGGRRDRDWSRFVFVSHTGTSSYLMYLEPILIPIMGLIIIGTWIHTLGISIILIYFVVLVGPASLLYWLERLRFTFQQKPDDILLSYIFWFN